MRDSFREVWIENFEALLWNFAFLKISVFGFCFCLSK